MFFEMEDKMITKSSLVSGWASERAGGQAGKSASVILHGEHAVPCFLCRISQYWTSYQTQLVSGVALSMRVVSISWIGA